jgi:hypothetical protein
MAARPSFPKYLRPYVKAAEQAGWRVEPTKSGHVRFLPSDKTCRAIVAASTPSECRGELNLRAALRRAGLELPR